MGIGDWGLGIGPNPQSPIPNPHLYINCISELLLFYLIKKYEMHTIIYII